MELSRTVGIEMEGYIFENPYQTMIPLCDITYDESLRNCYWGDVEPGEEFGVEIVTKPLTDLDKVKGIFEKMKSFGWETDERAGTHIHVDISDFSEYDKAKLLRFGKGIERLIFMFTKPYRNDNHFCEKIPNDWRKIFWKRSKFKDVDWDFVEESEDLLGYLNNYRRDINTWNGKYHWMNIFSSNYGTCEFRLFHAVERSEELIKQAQLAYSIVELVKNTTVEQLEYIIKSIYDQDTVEEMIKIFFDAVNLDFEMPVLCDDAYSYLQRKIERRNEEAQAV